MLTRWLVALAILVPLGSLGWPALCGQWTFGFRDAGHYYYPLYEHVASRWRDGPPLWNPLENGGQPLAADATAAVFYPGKACFLLPLSYTLCWNLYVIAHLLLAAMTMYGAARVLGSTPPAATLAALAYAFGGAVLAQHANVVYLVGAAWLPAACAALHGLVHRPGIWPASGLAVSLALMVLGGDPQLAYMTVVIGLAYLWFTRATPALPCETEEVAEDAVAPAWLRTIGKSPTAWFLLAVSVASGLAAVQVLPAWEWNAQTERVYFNSPRSLYEVPAFLARSSVAEKRNPPAGGPSLAAGLWGKPQSGTHHEHVYYFSVGPWRLVEFVWPNFYGREYPENHRWGAVLPREQTTWTPSIYMGLLPFLLAMGGCRWFAGEATARWLTWTAAFSLGASFGWFGIGWLWTEVARWSTGATEMPLGEPTGGLYWLLTVVLPGFVQFRYPAKLLVLASLALSLLAARGFDRCRSLRGQTRLRPRLLGAAALSLVVLLTVLFTGGFWPKAFAAVAPNPLYGPLDLRGAWRDLIGDLCQTLLVAAAALAIGVFAARRDTRSWTPWAAVALVAVDVVVAHAWMLSYVPAEILAKQASPPPSDSGRIYRDEPHAWTPPEWRTGPNSHRRQEEIVAWEWQTLRPKYGLAAGQTLVESRGSGQQLAWEQLLYTARRHGPPLPDGRRMPDPALLARLNVVRLIGPSEMLSRASAFYTRETGVPRFADAARVRASAPRAWTCRQFRGGDFSSASSLDDWSQAMHEAWYPAGRLVDLANDAVLDSPLAVRQLRDAAHAPQPKEMAAIVERVTWEEESPEQLVCRVELPTAALVIFSDAYDPNWQASATSVEPGLPAQFVPPVLRVQGVLRGVPLPAGRWKLTLAYRPASYRWGVVLSCSSFAALAVALLIAVGMGFRAPDRPVARRKSRQATAEA